MGTSGLPVPFSKGKSRRKSVLFGVAASGWFALETIVEKIGSSHAAIH